jgi:hypothetical protein
MTPLSVTHHVVERDRSWVSTDSFAFPGCSISRSLLFPIRFPRSSSLHVPSETMPAISVYIAPSVSMAGLYND